MEQQCPYSPTYLRTNLLTPLRTPLRETVPRTNIIAGGTSVAFKPKEWGSCATEYGGVGRIEDVFYRRKLNPVRELPYPRSHLHYISGISKVLHNVVQPHDITALRKSNCRQNDQLIPHPQLMTDHSPSKEENHFVQEPIYSSHICRTSMFPQNRLEQQSAANRQSELEKMMPLCKNTISALSRVIRNRHKVTSYEKEYRTMSQHRDNNHSTNKNFTKASCKEKKGHFKTEERFVRKQKSFSALCPLLNRNAKGLWPCWPVGSNYIVSNVTGQIIEKRDVLSLDDKRDYRRYKLSLLQTKIKSATKKKEKEVKEESRDDDDDESRNTPTSEEDEEVKTETSEENERREFSELNMDIGDKDIDQSTEDMAKTDEVDESKEVPLVDEERGCANEITDSVKLTTAPETDEKAKGNKINVPVKNETEYSRKTTQKWRRNFVVTAANVTACSKVEVLPEQEVLEKINSKDFRDLKIDRKVETLYLLLQSLSSAERQKLSAATRLRSALPRAPEFHPIKLPPEPLHNSLYYAGDRVANRLGVRFKTVALKRYHLIHPETIPDLQDFRPPARKCKFLGYHTSTFR